MADENAPFEFLVMGCMPYYLPQDEARFQNVIATANQTRPAFSVHCGDTKGGQRPCDDAVPFGTDTLFAKIIRNIAKACRRKK